MKSYEAWKVFCYCIQVIIISTIVYLLVTHNYDTIINQAEFLGGGTPIPQLLASALGALGDIFRSGPVPLPDGGVGVAVSQGRAAAAAAEGKGQEEKEKEEEVAVVQAQAVGSSSSKAVGALLLSKRDLVEMLAAQLTAAKEVKVVCFFLFALSSLKFSKYVSKCLC